MRTLSLIASALLLGGCAFTSPSPLPAPEVHAVVETDVVNHEGDAADDPAIYVHAADSRLSLVIGTDKKGALELYDLQGKRLQRYEGGRYNNVDLRPYKNGALVTASNRTDNTIAFFMLDPETKRLSPLGSAPTGYSDTYGLCMGVLQEGMSVYITTKSGAVGRYAISTDNGKITAPKVNELKLESQVEGCVVDDATGAFYIGEENRGLWKFTADFKTQSGELLDTVLEEGHLREDVEGVSIYRPSEGTSYVVASSQGDNRYVFYTLPDHRFAGSVRVADGTKIDGSSETDGLDVTAQAVTSQFPKGFLVVQDGENIPETTQNFKYIDMRDVLKHLN